MVSSRKKTLITAITVLFAFVLLVAVSMAWFTLSTSPEVVGIKASVVANENLEIALNNDYDSEIKVDEATMTDKDSGHAFRWGNLVDMKSSDPEESFKQLNKKLRPVKLENGRFVAPLYENDGRIKDLSLDLEEVDTNGKSFGNLKDKDGNVYGYYINIWIRSNLPGKVTLSEAAKRRTNGTKEGEGSIFSAEGGSDEANAAFANNVCLAIKDITPGAGSGNINPLKTEYLSGAKSKFTGDVVELKEDEAKMIRIYVYMNGENITNAFASVSDKEIKGNINLQFKMDGVDESMTISKL